MRYGTSVLNVCGLFVVMNFEDFTIDKRAHFSYRATQSVLRCYLLLKQKTNWRNGTMKKEYIAFSLLVLSFVGFCSSLSLAKEMESLDKERIIQSVRENHSLFDSVEYKIEQDLFLDLLVKFRYAANKMLHGKLSVHEYQVIDKNAQGDNFILVNMNSNSIYVQRMK